MLEQSKQARERRRRITTRYMTTGINMVTTLRLTSVAVGAALMLGAASLSAGFAGAHDANRQGAYLTYFNAPSPDDDLASPPHLRVSFGGRSYGAVMDTGSTGVVVSADKIPDVDRLPSLGAGKLTYSSSGRIMTGRWVMTPVTVIGANGSSVTTTSIPVLAVTKVECTATARRCTPNDSPRSISMLGIGFARRGDHQMQSGPDANPFLNVATAGAGMRRGYIVTRQGVQVGLADNAGADFAMVRLARTADDRDWTPAPACISVNDAAPAACGSLLMDTGVTTMYLTVPEDQAPSELRTWDEGSPTLRPGTKVRIAIPDVASTRAFYAFSVGEETSPLAPDRLVLVGRANATRTPFVNTSVRFLNGFDYLYDADGGFVGLRWTGHAGPDFGRVMSSN
jgi:hypothetical protein